MSSLFQHHLVKSIRLLVIALLLSSATSLAQVTLLLEKKISDKGLFFDGEKVAQGAANGPKYDYIFGNRITPHGDCIKQYKEFTFMTWYRGGEADRHVMLSRYNANTGNIVTIEFPHQHNGFQNTPHLGESHNTIAVGICPLDETIHLLYDMHSYSENRPANGSLANDYFRYSYSVKNGATVSDADFKLNKFVKDSDGDYKHLKMKPGVNYKSLTYPNFFTNELGELFMWIREGGNNNGAYKFCKYDGNSWTGFTQFNILSAKNKGLSYNWGLYGDIKFESGKMRIGFHIRSNNNNDKYRLNSGFYYGSSDDPNGLNQWKDHKGTGFSLPLIDPDKIKISEPGDVVNASGANSVSITRGADWTVTDRGDIHFVSEVSGGGQKKNVHTYKKAGDNTFKTSTSFPGGNLYTYNNEVYLIGLDNGKVFVEKADGGTNTWTKIYSAPAGSKSYRHGNVHINAGKLYFYMMEKKSGSAQPIYLQIYDLGLDDQQENNPPIGSFTEPMDTVLVEGYASLYVLAEASDPDGDEVSTVLRIDGVEVRPEIQAPYEWGKVGSENQSETLNLSMGEHIFEVVITDEKGAITTISKTIIVIEERKPFGDSPIVIPGVLEAEFFDKGGEGIAYHDSGTENNGAAESNFRVNDGVDIGIGNEGYVIGWTANSEWTEYTVDVTSSGEMEFVFHVSSKNGGGEIGLDVDGSPLISNLSVPQTNDWDVYTTMMSIATLPIGEHIIRVNIENPGFNIDRIEVTPTTVTGLNYSDKDNLAPYPNPSGDGVFNFDRAVNWELKSLKGVSLLHGEGKVVDAASYKSGTYLLLFEGRAVRLVIR